MTTVTQVKPAKEAPAERSYGCVPLHSILRICALGYLIVALIGAVPAVMPGMTLAAPQSTIEERVAVLELGAENRQESITTNQEDIKDIIDALAALAAAHEDTMRSVDTILSYAKMGVQILAAIAITVFVEVTRRLLNIIWPWPRSRRTDHVNPVEQ